ncbi:MAG: site-specific integrase [Pseudodesulfovibrio sp.]|nr:site-specific integrase [Pseudodesulfovibrio sp.]
MPKITRSPNHLYLKGNIYYFRQSVPADIRPYVGQSEVRVSLRTGFRAKARPYANRLSSGVSSIIKLLRGMIDMGFQDDVKAKWDDYIQWELRETEERGFDGTPVYKSSSEIDAFLKLFQDLLARKDYDELIKIMEEMAKDGAPGLPADMRKKRVYAHEFARSHVKLYTILKHRAQGDYDFEKTVMPSQPTYAAPTSEPEKKQKPVLTLKEALKRYEADKTAKKEWSNAKSAGDTMSTLKCLPDILGEHIPIDTIDRNATRLVRDTLLQLPLRRNSTNIFKNKTIPELVALEPDQTISVRTVNNNIGNASTFFTWCEDEELIVRNPCMRLKIKEEKDDIEHRSPFTDKDLHNIFYSPGYMQDTFHRPSDFWVPILGLYTGARREELCQLHVEDVRQERGVWVLDINKKFNVNGFDRKKLKNKNAKRLIPLHPFLADVMKFPEFAKRQEEKKHLRVFPELVRINTNYGHKFGERFSNFRNTIELEESEGAKVFHSFRHTFADFYKQREIQTDPFEQTFGHKLEKLAASTYGGIFPPDLCFERVISKLDYELDLAHLTKSKFVIK